VYSSKEPVVHQIMVDRITMLSEVFRTGFHDLREGIKGTRVCVDNEELSFQYTHALEDKV